MYDPQNERREFVAQSREQAIAKAREFFGMEPDALEIGEFPVGAVYGLAGRTAIVAAPRDRKPIQGGDGGGGRDRGRDRDRGDRGDRGERGGRGGRGDRDRDRGGRGGRARGGRDRDREDSRAAAPRSDEPSVGSRRGELGKSGEFVLGVMERLRLGPFEIGENAEGELVVCEVRGVAAQALASSDGRAVEALALLANQAAVCTDENARRVVLDVEGSTDAREEFLERLAEQVVRRAREGGRAIALDPMNGRDRRIIHLAVREHDGMATMSIGEGRYRQVVVVPEGAEEYEEALRQTEVAQQGA
jgi:spoIIIJ-associated protein